MNKRLLLTKRRREPSYLTLEATISHEPAVARTLYTSPDDLAIPILVDGRHGRR